MPTSINRFRSSSPRRTQQCIAAGVILVLAILGSILGYGFAQAIPRGDHVSFPGGIGIANFVLPNGKKAYCIEIDSSEPTGWIVGTWVTDDRLPGKTGVFTAYKDKDGMRRMNYLLDVYGAHPRSAMEAAAVGLSIWRLRARSGANTAEYQRQLGIFASSPLGRDVIARSDRLISESRTKAKLPVAPVAVRQPLSLEQDPGGDVKRMVVKYPKGTQRLQLSGARFEQNRKNSIAPSLSRGGSLVVEVTGQASAVTVDGSWLAQGTRGWLPELRLYSTVDAAGSPAQRLVVSTGESKAKRLTGTFARVSQPVLPDIRPPAARSQADPTASVGGRMSDELIIEEVPGTQAEMWPNAVADFTAYLEPRAGELKMDDQWQPSVSRMDTEQAVDQETGAPLWDYWWTSADGQRLVDASGAPVSAFNADGSIHTGTLSNGEAFPIVRAEGDTAEAGGPEAQQFDDSELQRYFFTRTPRMIEVPIFDHWSEKEIEAMTAAERCTAQPVARVGPAPVTEIGTIRSPGVRARSVGTIHWVERVRSDDKTVHQGVCGLASETTEVGRPNVITRAPHIARIGDEIQDTAEVSGELDKELKYEIRFEAYSKRDSTPLCTAQTRVFESSWETISDVGTISSPSLRVHADLGEEVWWVETLRSTSTDDDQETLTVHRGECGLPEESTKIAQPVVQTQAPATAQLGERVSDRALVSGDFVGASGARWELTFQAFHGDPNAKRPECTPETLLATSDPVPVTGDGVVQSPELATSRSWVGTVWWVETLWLIDDGAPQAMHVGACGEVNETTQVQAPTLETRADEFALVGDQITDVAHIAGPLSKKDEHEYSVQFRLYRGDKAQTGSEGAECRKENLVYTSSPVAIREAGQVSAPPVTSLPEWGETLWWVATLSLTSSEGEQVIARGTCGEARETTTQQFPVVSTVASGTVMLGESVFDTARVEGALSRNPDVKFHIEFRAYAVDAQGKMTCRVSDRLHRFDDVPGVNIASPGTYESRHVRATMSELGNGGFQEALIMDVGGKQHVVSQGRCGEPSEAIHVRTPLAQSGALPWLGLTGCASIMMGGAGLLLLRRSRKANRAN